jgi:predicted outer membrane protein
VAAVEVEDAEKAVVVDAEKAKDAEKMVRNLEVVEIKTRIITTNPQLTDVIMTKSLLPRHPKMLPSRKEAAEVEATMELLKTTWQDKLVLIT